MSSPRWRGASKKIVPESGQELVWNNSWQHVVDETYHWGAVSLVIGRREVKIPVFCNSRLPGPGASGLGKS